MKRMHWKWNNRRKNTLYTKTSWCRHEADTICALAHICKQTKKKNKKKNKWPKLIQAINDEVDDVHAKRTNKRMERRVHMNFIEWKYFDRIFSMHTIRICATYRQKKWTIPELQPILFFTKILGLSFLFRWIDGILLKCEILFDFGLFHHWLQRKILDFQLSFAVRSFVRSFIRRLELIWWAYKQFIGGICFIRFNARRKGL